MSEYPKDVSGDIKCLCHVKSPFMISVSQPQPLCKRCQAWADYFHRKYLEAAGQGNLI